MTLEQFYALEKWIKAMIGEALDDSSSSDAGLISMRILSECRDGAMIVLVKEFKEQSK